MSHLVLPMVSPLLMGVDRMERGPAATNNETRGQMGGGGGR
jgi:hypothetical protein